VPFYRFLEYFIHERLARRVFEAKNCHFYLLGINLTSLLQKLALNQRKARDTQLLLGLCDRLYPGVRLGALSLLLGHELTVLHLEVFLGQTSSRVGRIPVVHLSTRTNRHLLLTFIFFGRLEVGWEGVVHGGKSNLLDEGVEPLSLRGATGRLGLGYTERPDAVRGCGHATTLHCENPLESLDIHLGRLGHLGQDAGVIEHVGAHLGFALLKLQDALLD